MESIHGSKIGLLGLWLLVTSCASAVPTPSAAPTPSVASTLSTQAVPKPGVIALKFEADWCAPCKELSEKLKPLLPEYENASILFVTFDFTDEATIANGAHLATMLDVREIFDRQFGQLSVVWLVSTHTNEVLGKLEADQSSEKMASIIRDAIQRATQSAQ